MTSWRDTASQQVQDDLDCLLNAVLPFAQQMLDKHGEFFPFGSTVTTDGETAMIAGDPRGGEHPASADVLATIVDGLRSRRDTLRAIAIVADVRADGSDAVRVELEHRDGHAIGVLTPYKKKRLGRGIEYGTLRAGAARQQVWSSA